MRFDVKNFREFFKSMVQNKKKNDREWASLVCILTIQAVEESVPEADNKLIQ